MTELTANNYSIAINGVDYTRYCPFPIKWSNLLDEQLDEASISLIKTSVGVIKPLTSVEIRLWNGNTPQLDFEYNFVVADSHTTETPVGSGKFNHDLYLIEETKLLEGFYVRSHGYVNALAKDIGEATAMVPGTLFDTHGTLRLYDDFPTFTSPRNVIEPPAVSENSYFFPKFNTIFADAISGGITFTYGKFSVSDGTDVLYERASTSGAAIAQFFDSNFYVPESVLRGTAVYKITYEVEYNSHVATVTYYAVLNSSTPITPPTELNIKTVIERALAICEPLRVGETPRFSLNAEQAAIFETIKAPEFHFTQSNLREILQDIGKYIHGEPRLKNGVIYYDMYGSGAVTEYKYGDYASAKAQQTIEQYATNIDSSVDNLVDSIGYAKGVRVEPFNSGAKTVRTESVYARIEESNLFIATDNNINSVVKLEWYDKRRDGKYWDITPYVYEQADYTNLSSYHSAFPYSKAYAVYYTQNGKGIKGLMFKETSHISPVFLNYSIINILRAVTGESGLAINDITPNSLYSELAFRVTYQPMISARVQQSKMCVLGIDTPRTIAYNQGQNVIEAHYYGENLKGAIARLGNIDKTYSFVFNGLPNIPEVGKLWDDDYYISAVAVEVMPFTTKIDVALSKDFNRYSAYIALDKQKRQYEISEKAAYDSYYTYRDYCVVGNALTAPTLSLILSGVVISDTFKQTDTSAKPITAVFAQGIDKNDNNLQKVILTCQPVPLGNAAVFVARYKDNYSAGTAAIYQQSGDVSGLFTNDIPYKDFFGDMEALHVQYLDNVDLETVSTDTVLQVAEDFPKLTEGVITTPQFGTLGGAPLLVKFGNTEIPTVNYQLDFVTNRSDVIIGSAFAKNFIYVSGHQTGHAAKLYLFPNRINKFSQTIDVSAATEIGYAMTNAGQQTQIMPATAFSGNFKAYAFVDGATNEIIVGGNRTITGANNVFNDDGSPLYITLCHNY